MRTPRRHDHDAGGPSELLAAKAELRERVWAELTDARVARFPGARGRIPNFTGAEAAAERLRATEAWRRARTIKANPDSAQWPVRQRALEDGKTVYMAVPRLAEESPFFLLDPANLADTPRRASSIRGATASAVRVAVADLEPVDLVVTGCVAVDRHGTRLGKGGGFSDLEFAVAAEGRPGRAGDARRHHRARDPGQGAGCDPVGGPRRAAGPRRHPGAGHRLPGRLAPAEGRRPVGRADRGEDRGDPAAGQDARRTRRDRLTPPDRV
nr:hypothetical protein GCM10020241_13220 [Streptoalloteichus tenebrarius]